MYNGKVLTSDKINDHKVVDLTLWEAISRGHLDMNLPITIINSLSDNTKILETPDSRVYKKEYDLSNKDDFETLRKQTDLTYDDINNNTKIVFINGMMNSYDDARNSAKLISKDFDKVGLINNSSTYAGIGDIIEWFPNYLTTKDVLTAYKLQQLSPGTIIITHSAGNEDIFKTNKINYIQGVKTPYK
ncbi:hypothetical protein, partial [Campylobacter sputorum]